jgi:hypothetical protein
MNSNTLSLIGCSGSLAFVLLVGNVASADTLTPQSESVAVPTALERQNAEVVLPSTSKTPAQVNPQYMAIDPNSDTVGDLAISKFKCDCPACRVAIVQMLQTGQLSL